MSTRITPPSDASSTVPRSTSMLMASPAPGRVPASSDCADHMADSHMPCNQPRTPQLGPAGHTEQPQALPQQNVLRANAPRPITPTSPSSMLLANFDSVDSPKLSSVSMVANDEPIAQHSTNRSHTQIFRGPQIEVDDGVDSEARDAEALASLAEWRRLKRQREARFRDHHPNAYWVENMVQDMIARGSQCNAHKATALPTRFDSSSATNSDIKPDAPIEPVRHRPQSPPPHEDDDEGYCEGQDDETGSDANLESLRTAARLHALRPLGSLRLRASDQRGSRPRRLIKSTPRMRRRRDPPVTEQQAPTTAIGVSE